MKYEDYEDLVNGLKNDLPLTWYPALLIVIIEIVIDKKIFKGRLSLLKVIRRIMDDKNY